MPTAEGDTRAIQRLLAPSSPMLKAVNVSGLENVSRLPMIHLNIHHQ